MICQSKTSNAQGADRIIIKERQNPLTVDHLNKLAYHSNKIGTGGWDSNPRGAYAH